MIDKAGKKTKTRGASTVLFMTGSHERPNNINIFEEKKLLACLAEFSHLESKR
jgi:hypothetical protein